MEPETLGQLGGWIGGIGGSVIGILGGAFGTYCAIRGTKGPVERAFVVRISAICWVLALAFLLGMLLIPSWYKFLLFIPYTLLMIFGILWLNKTQCRIRNEEAGRGG